MSWQCPGFLFAGAVAGIKKKGGLDIGLIASEAPASCAAVFTRNRVRAAPVRLSRRNLRNSQGLVRGIIVNSGNANACTGPGGARDAGRMAELAARAIGAAPGEVLVASTGVIGQRLPMDRVEAGIHSAGVSLYDQGFAAFSEAIMTTDRRPKVASHPLTLGGRPITLMGCTKGAGMIAPNMATTLTFIVTDAGIDPARLDPMVRRAVGGTYNAMTVDGDQSTNDMLAVMASGVAGTLDDADHARFGDALLALCADLAHQLMSDGEGVHHVVTIAVRGATSETAARAVARKVATSPLVKTAIAGADPNWGRILCAIGNAGVQIDARAIEVAFDDVPIVAHSTAVPDLDDARAAAVMQKPAYTIAIDLHQGEHRGQYLACDLSHEYVSINADYRS
ncbi:MAG: bifunctional glutamate N-acetyltransferase/amino-acid acetyltransferase ArgJ [Deltaproteobacteria bacterium]|nr:bifunctional glutamate N-acetyltransferase/amino-acid acetyltransferase ArgJ [Deltaproteobacteria bacterium]